jgi:cation diffusion facilitator family transporter
MNLLKSRKAGYIVGSVSILVNLILFALKYWAGKRAGSVAIVADAWHTLSDSLTSIIVIVGFWIAGIPKDKEHPFGHGRAESIGAIVIGTILAFVGVEFVQESIRHLRSRETTAFDTLALLVTGLSVVVKEILAQVSIRVGRAKGSQTMIADGWHHRSDAISSGLVLIGIIFGMKIWWIDGVLGFLVSTLIIYAAWEIIKDASHTILGEKPPEAIAEYLAEYSEGDARQIFDIHSLSFHRYGTHKELTLHAVVPDSLTNPESCQLVTALEKDIERRFRSPPAKTNVLLPESLNIGG